MNIEQAEDAILTKFMQDFGELDEEHVALPNKPFTPDGTAYVRISVQPNLGYQAGMGDPANRRTRREGLVFVQVFVPLGDGTSQANTLAKAASDAISNCRVGSGNEVLLRASEIRTIGRDPIHELWQVNVSVPFQFDEIG